MADAPGPWGEAPPKTKRSRRGLILIALTAAGSAVSVAAIGAAWSWIGGAPMSVHGWIALTIGVMGTGTLTAGLMALAFHSSRSGHDDRVEKTEDVNDRITRLF